MRDMMQNYQNEHIFNNSLAIIILLMALTFANFHIYILKSRLDIQSKAIIALFESSKLNSELTMLNSKMIHGESIDSNITRKIKGKKDEKDI